MTINKVYIFLDGKPKPPKDLNLTSKLNEIREIIKESLSNNFLFLTGNDEIPKNEENDWKLNDIIISKTDKICLNLKYKVIQTITDDFTAPVRNSSINVKNFANQINKHMEEKEQKTNVPLKGSTLLYTKKKDKNADEEPDDEGKIKKKIISN